MQLHRTMVERKLIEGRNTKSITFFPHSFETFYNAKGIEKVSI